MKVFYFWVSKLQFKVDISGLTLITVWSNGFLFLTPDNSYILLEHQIEEFGPVPYSSISSPSNPYQSVKRTHHSRSLSASSSGNLVSTTSSENSDLLLSTTPPSVSPSHSGFDLPKYKYTFRKRWDNEIVITIMSKSSENRIEWLSITDSRMEKIISKNGSSGLEWRRLATDPISLVGHPENPDRYSTLRLF